MATDPEETALLDALDHHDALVRQCAVGALSFREFCTAYENFYWVHALDGHESDSAGQALLDRLATRIAPHHVLAETVLARVCFDTNANIVKADRIGSEEALVRLRRIAADLLY
ncbi:hypothetical protein ABQW55_000795 [Xanthomonas citri pv. malvacearum]|uniref:hypothetical protein n=1 Tax=Xanthomonas TaxID=338 RepID=UPI000F791446|nr:hypothetical protein [Xanthomonas citri]MCC4631535.1 hypothetical protein [Xanthomonas citri]NMI15778.1 hypothetical protein [Xanthomonas citri]QGL16088.1 hypothetical protein GH913_04055 [Xanthomonas citri pv. malvacearum]WAW87238.1 hypothetical protein LPY96_01510 [Xanthomonas citri pv. malvacearum]WAW91375.1 hypothetical protein LPY95_00795 [Xanthomonas citri pv. malvacearum]